MDQQCTTTQFTFGMPACIHVSDIKNVIKTQACNYTVSGFAGTFSLRTDDATIQARHALNDAAESMSDPFVSSFLMRYQTLYPAFSTRYIIS